MISYDLNSGYPDVHLAPQTAFEEIMAEAIRSGRGLQYAGNLRGHSSIREQVALFLSRTTGQLVNPSEVMVTTGSLQAIELICRSLLRPGDTIAVEAPTFPLALQLFALNKADILQVPLDRDGIDLSALQAFVQRYPGRLRFLYTIPSYQNPTGVCTCATHREQLVKLAIQHGFFILEDTAYHFLNYTNAPPPMLKCFGAGDDHVITVGSFSKIVFPSLRQGWIWATSPQIESFARRKTDGSTSLLTSLALAEYLRNDALEQHLHDLRKVYHDKCVRALSCLREGFSSWASWTTPEGGFYIWVTMSEAVSVKALRARALARGVDILPGEQCYAKVANDAHFRLCFTCLPIEQLETAIHILSTCLE